MGASDLEHFGGPELFFWRQWPFSLD